MKQEGRSIPSVAGPISKAVPRGNVSLDGSFWHKDAEVSPGMKSPGSQSLGRGESGQRAEPVGKNMARRNRAWRWGGGVPLQELGQGGPSGEEGKGSSWEDVRKAGDSYTPSLHLEFDISHSDEEEHCGPAGTE